MCQQWVSLVISALFFAYQFAFFLKNVFFLRHKTFITYFLHFDSYSSPFYTYHFVDLNSLTFPYLISLHICLCLFFYIELTFCFFSFYPICSYYPVLFLLSVITLLFHFSFLYLFFFFFLFSFFPQFTHLFLALVFVYLPVLFGLSLLTLLFFSFSSHFFFLFSLFLSLNCHILSPAIIVPFLWFISCYSPSSFPYVPLLFFFFLSPLLYSFSISTLSPFYSYFHHLILICLFLSSEIFCSFHWLTFLYNLFALFT